jgi:Xaa-Pro aminopeptidase
MQRTLVQKELLAPAELQWLNAYHAEVLEKLAPLVAHDARATAWLERECQPL